MWSNFLTVGFNETWLLTVCFDFGSFRFFGGLCQYWTRLRSFCSKKNPTSLGNPLWAWSICCNSFKGIGSPVSRSKIGCINDASKYVQRFVCNKKCSKHRALSNMLLSFFIQNQEVWKLSCQRDQPLKTQRWKLFTILDIIRIKCNQWIL